MVLSVPGAERTTSRKGLYEDERTPYRGRVDEVTAPAEGITIQTHTISYDRSLTVLVLDPDGEPAPAVLAMVSERMLTPDMNPPQTDEEGRILFEDLPSEPIMVHAFKSLDSPLPEDVLPSKPKEVVPEGQERPAVGRPLSRTRKDILTPRGRGRCQPGRLDALEIPLDPRVGRSAHLSRRPRILTPPRRENPGFARSPEGHIRSTPATLCDRGRGWGRVGDPDRRDHPAASEHRRDVAFRLRGGRGRAFRPLRESSPGGRFFSGEVGRRSTAGEIMMIDPIVPPTLRFTAAALRDRKWGRGCWGG